MAITGFDPSLVATSISNVNIAYSAIITALVDTNYNSFVSPMSAVWGSPQAKTFFSNYQSVIESMCSEVSKIFTSVVDSMNGAASSLAAIAGATWASQSVWTTSKALDVSCVKEALGDGTIGIDVEQATAVASQLDIILRAVSTGLQDAITAVNTSGFVGGDMQSSLISSLNKIESNISNQFTDIKFKVNQAIQDTVSTYVTTSGNVSTAFGGGAN